MSYKLFLDDIRRPDMCIGYMHRRIGALNSIYLEEWVIVKNYDEFTKYIIQNGLPTHISFDHDLADEHYKMTSNEQYWIEYHMGYDRECTGYDCAKWLVDYLTPNSVTPICFIHSMNPVGVEFIKKVLDGTK